jgi:hypothetical protein
MLLRRATVSVRRLTLASSDRPVIAKAGIGVIRRLL